MIGAIIGDIIGSVYEWHNVKSMNFDLFTKKSIFTDDTVLTIAHADSILSGVPFIEKLKEYYSYYPDAGYGSRFHEWVSSDSNQPYYSWGNGSAMRVSPAGFAYDNLDDVLFHARKSAKVTHNHPEGIKGAESVAAAIFLARTGADKKKIKQYIESNFNYDLSREINRIRPSYGFDVSCQGSVPEAIIAFLESKNYLHAIRKGISLGGDSDTIACITGGIAQAYYKKIPEDVEARAYGILDKRLKKVIKSFRKKFSC